MKCGQVNRKLLPIKCYHFFFYAGVASLVPFLAVYLKEEGWNPLEVGIIYTIIPFTAVLGKPLVGALADYLRAHKMVLLVSIFLMTAFFMAILLVPPIRRHRFSHQVTPECSEDGLSAELLYCHDCQLLKVTEPQLCELVCPVFNISLNGTALKTSDVELKIKLLVSKSVVDNGHAVTPFNTSSNFNTVTDKVFLNKNANTSSIGAITESTIEKYLFCNAYKVTPRNTGSFTAICDAVKHANNHLFSCTVKCKVDMLQCAIVGQSEKGVRLVWEFWALLTLYILSKIFFLSNISMLDMITFVYLGEKDEDYGKQRLWGTFGWGIFASITGIVMSEVRRINNAEYMNFNPAFYLFFGFMIIVVIINFTLTVKVEYQSQNIAKDVFKICRKPAVLIFLFAVVALGIQFGALITFSLWYLGDLGATELLFGFDLTAETVCELPFFFISGFMIKKIGHVRCFYIAFLAYGARFIIFSFMRNPWWTLAMNLFHGPSFGLMYATAVSYCNLISPRGTAATMQAFVAGLFDGIGSGFGSLIGGFIYEEYGGAITFRSFGIAAIVCCCLYAIAQLFVAGPPLEEDDDVPDTDKKGVDVDNEEVLEPTKEPLNMSQRKDNFEQALTYQNLLST